jgi:hypothetical protein
MKYFLAAILILFVASMFYQTDDPYLSEAEKLVNSILSSTAKMIKKKYKIKPCGTGASMPGGPIKELALCFDTNDQLSKQDLRKLLIECADELLAQVQLNDKIQPFLSYCLHSAESLMLMLFWIINLK